MRHHRRFNRVHPRAVRVTRDVAKLHPWLDTWTSEAKLMIARDLVDKLSAIYGMPAPRVEYHAMALVTGGGFFETTTLDELDELGGRSTLEPGIIGIGGPFSLLTLLHEFRHAMQAVGARTVGEGSEDDARAWSLSLYARAVPRRFRRMLSEDRVLYMTLADLRPWEMARLAEEAAEREARHAEAALDAAAPRLVDLPVPPRRVPPRVRAANAREAEAAALLRGDEAGPE